MNNETERFELPGKIERLLATLSKLYAQEGKRSLQAIIVNARVHVNEGYSYDNWNGGTYGHALHLLVPEQIYLENHRQRVEVQKQISQDLNQLHNLENEFIEVILEMDIEENSRWRQESGLLVTGTRTVTPDAAERLWTAGDFRLFLSHRAEVKQQVATLKSALRYYGISAFVAHEDIQPTREWQEEIENALTTMDGLVALLTSNFHESDWTDQEVGYALARGVPIIAVRLEREPYGFLGRTQAMSSTWNAAPEGIVKLLINNDRMLSAYIGAIRRCPNFDTGNMLASVLPSIGSVSEKQIQEIIEAFNSNSELQGSFGFNGNKPRDYGGGLLPHLNRWGARRYTMTGNFPKRIVPDI